MPDPLSNPKGDPPGFPIAGVGASAGGLEALTELLRHLPVDTGMGFVVVQHLDPQHESALTTLLSRATRMPVSEVTTDLRVEPDHIYVIPPNTQMEINGGVLKLTPRSKVRGATRSIDFFFESLASDQRERAIGVVLSGTASDGTQGLEAIRAEGGVTFAQDESAKYDSMPRSAIAAGVVDFVLAPEAMAAELGRIAQHPFVVGGESYESLHSHESHRFTKAAGKNGGDGKNASEGSDVKAPPGLHSEMERESDQREGRDAPLASGGHGTPRTDSQQAKQEAAAPHGKPAQGEDGFRKILLILRRHCGVDFTLYKSSTIQRRVMRRLVLNKHETLASYADFLRGNALELDALYSDVLISVTSFFRNPEAFDALKSKVFPQLLAQHGRNEPVRVWVLGCSTGQEAYSLAMAFAEAVGVDAPTAKLQIFATDLNEALLEKARSALYAKSLAQDLSPERLQRFFVEEDGGYRVSKVLREQVVFARQNVMSDPPFSRIDLITCRNLLIYLEPELQKKIFPAFHYALKRGGFLFLGASESIGQFTELFEPADKKQKIFARKDAPSPAFRLPLPGGRGMPLANSSRIAPLTSGGEHLAEGPRGEFNAQREADRICVSQFAPPGVLVNAEGQVLQFRGATGAFLEPPTGKASFDILKMAREGLVLPLRTAFQEAKRDNKSVRGEAAKVRQESGTRTVSLQVIPLRNLKEPCFLILFEDAESRAEGRSLPVKPCPPANPLEAAGRIAELERELAETRDYLQSIQEQNEAAHEEIQASNEEVQSANEELQSINEELETSKEELESSNEELTTVNDEMVSRNHELNRLNADFINVQASMQTVILILARDLTIRRFTPSAKKLFNLLSTDVGRGIGGIRHNLDAPDLERLLLEVVDTVSLREREVRESGGRWFMLRARPYFTQEHKVDGVVLVLNDIDALKRSATEINAARDYAEATLRTMPVPFLILSADLRVNSASDAFYRNFEVAPAETEGRLIYDLGNGQWDIPKLRTLLEEILPKESVFDGYEVTHAFESLGSRTMVLNARRLDSADGTPERILLAIEDITGRRREEEMIRESEERFSTALRAVSDLIWTNNAEGKMEGEQPGWGVFTGQTPAEYQGYGWSRAVHPDDAQLTIDAWKVAVAENRMFQFEHRVRRHDGAWRLCSIRAVPILGPDRQIREWVGVHTDVTESRQIEEQLRAAHDSFRHLVGHSPFGVYAVDADFRLVQVSAGAQKVFENVRPLIDQDFAEVLRIVWSEPFASEVIAIFRRVLETGEPYHAPSTEEERADIGEVEAYDWKVERIILPDGRPGAVCHFYDLSERLRYEARLRENETRVRLATEATTVGIWEWNVLTNAIRWDAQMFRIYGIAPTADGFVQYSDWSGAVLMEDLPENERILQDTVRACGQSRREFRIRRHNDGEVRDIEAVETVRINEHGEAEWVLGTNMDITERNAAEESLRLTSEELVRSSRSKDDFLAALSHELRTPLTPVLMMATALESDPALTPQVRDQISMMRRNIELEARLIDDLLDLTRISRGKLVIDRQPTDVHKLLDHTAEIVLSDRLGKEVRITFTHEAARHHARADSTRLQQVFWNLIKNAVKFTPPGGNITVATRNDEAGRIIISVADTGLGISGEALPHIFKAFEQGDVSGQHRYGGLGLGLAISKAIMEAHEGTILAESPGPGRGATFTIALDSAGAPAPLSPSHATPGHPSRTLRLLVVEDHETTRNVLEHLLTNRGHHVTTAGSIEEALTAFAADHFDGIISDLGLPDGSGLDLMQQIQRQRPIPGIALSGYGMEADLRRTKEAGFFAHLVKPVHLDQLRQLIDQITPPPS